MNLEMTINGMVAMPDDEDRVEIPEFGLRIEYPDNSIIYVISLVNQLPDNALRENSELRESDDGNECIISAELEDSDGVTVPISIIFTFSTDVNEMAKQLAGAEHLLREKDKLTKTIIEYGVGNGDTSLIRILNETDNED